MTSGLPFDDYRQLLRSLPGPDEGALARARARTETLGGQGPSLGRIGDLAEWQAGWTGRDPAVARPLVALFAGTHGVAAQGVSPLPPGATQAMIEHVAAGGAALNQLCAAADLGLKVFDLALHLPVGDITIEPALDERGCAATMAFGMESIAGGIDLLCVATIGAGGTTAAAAIMAALFGGSGADWVGPGAGVDEAMRMRKVAAVDRAIAVQGSHFGDPLEVLRRLGGREFAAAAGAILAARVERVPVILDGYVPLAAGAVLHAANPSALDHCVLAHVSTEPGMARAASRLGMRPLLDLSIGDGEGIGAALAAGVVKNSALVHSGMAIRR